MRLLALIKKPVFTEGTNDHTRPNKAMAHMNIMNLLQDRFLNIQEFRD